MACQTFGPGDWKIGMYIQLVPGSNLVYVRTPGRESCSAGPENQDVYQL